MRRPPRAIRQQRTVQVEQVPVDQLEEFLSWLKEEYKEEVLKIMGTEEGGVYYEVVIDLIKMIYYFPMIGGQFQGYPAELTNFIQDCFKVLQIRFLKDLGGGGMTLVNLFKTKLDIKFSHVPPVSEVVQESIRSLGH